MYAWLLIAFVQEVGMRVCLCVYARVCAYACIHVCVFVYVCVCVCCWPYVTGPVKIDHVSAKYTKLYFR